MKKHYFFIGLILLLSTILISNISSVEYIPLQKAIDQNMISYSVNGNPKGTHYSKPLIIKIKNLKNNNISLKIDNGLQFLPEDSAYQTIIIVNEELIVLKPNESKELILNGMCTESHDRGPKEATIYKTGKMASENIRKLTSIIQKKKWFDIATQVAVWAVTCNYPLEDIAGFDSLQVRELQKYASEITGKPIPPPPAPDDYIHNYVSPRRYRIKMSGEYEYSFPKKVSVHIAMFDTANIVVRELLNDQNVEPGMHTFKYTFDASVYTDSLYYLRFIADGEVMIDGEYIRPF